MKMTYDLILMSIHAKVLLSGTGSRSCCTTYGRIIAAALTPYNVISCFIGRLYENGCIDGKNRTDANWHHCTPFFHILSASNAVRSDDPRVKVGQVDMGASRQPTTRGLDPRYALRLFLKYAIIALILLLPGWYNFELRSEVSKIVNPGETRHSEKTLFEQGRYEIYNERCGTGAFCQPLHSHRCKTLEIMHSSLCL